MIFMNENHFQSFHSLPILNTFSIKWVSFTRLSSSSTSSFLFHGKRFQRRRDSCWKRKQKGFLWFKEGHSFNAMSVNPFWTAGQTIIRNNHQLLLRMNRMLTECSTKCSRNDILLLIIFIIMRRSATQIKNFWYWNTLSIRSPKYLCKYTQRYNL